MLAGRSSKTIYPSRGLAMKKLLQKWHWIHTWSKWEAEPMKYVSYPWTSPGHYAHKQLDQLRSCKVCGLQQSKTETIL